MAVTFLGLTIGDNGTGWASPTYAQWRGAYEQFCRERRGIANLRTEPGSFYGFFVDMAATVTDLACQAAGEAAEMSIFTAMRGVRLDQFLADYLKRVAASQSTATVWAYGTAGATALPGISIRSGPTSTPFQTTGPIGIPAAPATAYAVEIKDFAAGVYAGQGFTVTVAGNAALYIANGFDTGRTVRSGLVTKINDLLLMQKGWSAGTSPTNQSHALMVTGPAPFTLSVAGPVGTMTAYGAASSSATALVFGATYAPAESLRRGPPTNGITGFVNIVAATPGRVAETDSQFRARHMVAQRGLGGGSPDAIKAIALAAVESGGGGATFASVEYNSTDANPDAFGNAEHSVRLIIAQTDDGQNAANSLWRSKAAGDNTNGPELYQVADATNNLQPIRIDRLTDLWIAVQVSYTVGEGWPTSGTPEVQMEQDIVTYIEALAAGADVRVNTLPIATRLDGTARGVAEFAVRVGSSVTQGGPYVYKPYWPTVTLSADTASISLTGRQKARTQIVDVNAGP